ncbi:CBS domain-containing protein [Luedemannella helvata]|uniref:CBS domain-containing protein n=1 Tax=Luedemannella helvata TaxID=349315 RepID=A0ABN2JR37_9ACTN
MTQTVGDLMTVNPVSASADTPLIEVARTMRDEKIGDVLVTDNGQVAGVVTDRDITIRAVAEGLDPQSTPVGQVASSGMINIPMDAPLSQAVQVMRQEAVRRLLVTDESGTACGVISIGDLAAELDPNSALGTISGAPPND